MKRILRTVLFYVVAFVAHAIFLTLTIWLKNRAEQGEATPGDDYYSVIALLPALLSVLPMTLGSWILRRLMRRLPRTYIWQWILGGVVIGVALVWGLGWVGLRIEGAHFSLAWQNLKSALMLGLLLGPMMFTFQPWWLPVLALGLTAALLFLVQRAFGWQAASKKVGSYEVRK